MNLDFYRNFVVVAESYTISEAARRLNIAQPALSMQLKSLESYYGVQLIKTRQGSRHIELTAAGKLLYRRMRHILNATDLLRTDLKLVEFNELETISIGTTPELSLMLGAYIEEFDGKGNAARWKLVTRDVRTLCEYLEQKDVHCMIIPFSPAQAYLYDFHGEFQRQVYVVGRKDHPLLKDKSNIRLSSLQDQQICLSCELEDGFFRACREEGVEATLELRATSSLIAIDAALRKNTLGVVAGELPPWMASLVECVPLYCKYLRAEHYVYTQKNREVPKSVKNFLKYITARPDCESEK